MPDAVGQPQRLSQPSRKGKKAWRKNIGLADVEDGLENKREEIRHGGVVSEKTAEQLFAVDTEGSSQIRQTISRASKPLKAEQVLAQRSKVPAISGHKRTLSEMAPQQTTKKHRGEYVPRKEVERLKVKAYALSTRPSGAIEATDAGSYDVWTAEEPRLEVESEYIDKARPVQAPKTLKEAPIAIAGDGKSKAAVSRPHGGRSYNPDFQTWEQLYNEKGQAEVVAERARLLTAEKEKEREDRAMAIAAEPDPESSAEESVWESEWEGIHSEAEEQKLLAQRRPKQKTPAERNRIKRRKETEGLAKHEGKMKEKYRQLDQFKAIAKAADAKKTGQLSQSLEEPADDSSTDDSIDVPRRRRLGNAHIPQAPLEMVLPDELKETLRQLKPEGNLLNDRYRHMLINGRVETRKAIFQPKKPKRTVTEKWSYKDWKLK